MFDIKMREKTTEKLDRKLKFYKKSKIKNIQ